MSLKQVEDVTYLDILVDVPAVGDRAFTYYCPREIRLPRGAKVRVPFSQAMADGFVLGEVSERPPFAIKPIEGVYDLSFVPPSGLLDLMEELGRYYLATTAASWSYLYPPVVPLKKVAKILEEGGLKHDPPAPQPVMCGDHDAGGVSPPVGAGEPGCSEDRTGAALWKKMEQVPVLYVWGSPDFRWKHYLKLAEGVLAAGKGVLFLVPEAKVLDGSLARLNTRFPGKVSAVNSAMTGLVRRAAWLSLLRGEMKIGAGTRSAAFAPVPDLGLIVLDEEASQSHKALDWPFFDARTVALARGTEGARVVFGGAYPSVEAVLNIERSRWSCIREDSPKEAGGARPQEEGPRLRVIDLKGMRLGREIISEPLKEELEVAFSSGLRAVLFLNRRGDSSQVSCRDCGSVVSCPRCGVPMVYHSKEAQMACHTCGLREDAPEVCPGCGGHRWRFSGFGVEKVEAEFRGKFPEIPVFRLDQDVSRKSSPVEVLGAFGKVSPACLVCTQIVLGQSLIPPVGLVGVLSADTSLSVPDFRASERAYHLLSGLKDLVDRRLGSRGCFLVQTRNPDHHAIVGVSDGDHFYENELQMRKMLGYPPFRRFFRVRFESRSFDKAREAASEFASEIAQGGEVTVLGPAPAPKPKMRGVYRWHVALKGDDHGKILAECLRVLEARPKQSSVRVLVDVDPADTE
ncbi:MAG TPA: primosomal protein N' [Firmicutes bacterium]|nr:primosomal protein N' [Candidatus Fermentithermobacillaceae bacterium]